LGIVDDEVEMSGVASILLGLICPYTVRETSGSFAHAIQEHLETVSRIGGDVKVSLSVCANGVPSATATTEEDFTKHFLRADLLDA
jgi:hypothetical protein